MLAYRLKCSIAEVEQMRTVEFFEWLAFFEIYDKQHQQYLSSNKHVKRS